MSLVTDVRNMMIYTF